jgi:hypothetical protein
LAADADGAWVTSGPALLRLDRRHRAPRARVRLPDVLITGLAPVEGRVWAIAWPSQRLTPVTTPALRVGRWVRPGRRAMLDVAAGAGQLWTVLAGERRPRPGVRPVPRGPGRLVRLDPRTGATRGRTHVGRGAAAVVARGTGVWVANTTDRTLTRLDVGGRRLASIPYGELARAPGPVDLAQDRAGGPWLLDPIFGAGRLVTVRPGRRVATVVTVGDGRIAATQVAAGADGVFIALDAPGLPVCRLDPDTGSLGPCSP